MSLMKRYLEEHINEISDEELLEGGYSEEDIEFMRECFSEKDTINFNKQKES